ncbi:MAG: hypothetical protein U0168_15405 [Nannocystaceae bacterium]
MGVAIARALLLAYVSRGDALGAQAELALAQPQPPVEAVFEIDARQREAMGAATEAHRTQASLRDQGLDEGTARSATRGAAAYDFSAVHRFAFERARGVQWASLAGEPREHGGTLRAKKARGDQVVLQFDDIVTKYADEVCRDTNRVERIESDGRLVYGTKCRATGKTSVDRQPVPPVVVPARGKATSLQPGDAVRVVVTPGEAPAGGAGAGGVAQGHVGAAARRAGAQASRRGLEPLISRTAARTRRWARDASCWDRRR